jgi:predicted RNA-binding Zn-ribbon protein involved in translation (DUF1610 family)
MQRISEKLKYHDYKIVPKREESIMSEESIASEGTIVSEWSVTKLAEASHEAPRSAPVTDDFEEVRDRIIGTSHKRVRDDAFLKKMRVSRVSSSIDNFIDIVVKHRSNVPNLEETDEDSMLDHTKCSICNTILNYNEKECLLTCPLCGVAVHYQDYTKPENQPYGTYVSKTSYLYKRSNHFKTWIMRTQAKESTVVEQAVIDKVEAELRKERIVDMQTVTHSKVREILKKLRMNEYYNHSIQIASVITGIPPKTMTPEMEETLMQLFDRIQEPFQIAIRGHARKNFLSYSYLLHKFVQLLEWDEFLPYFPLLISTDKIMYQDLIWKRICEICDFDFIKSIM